MRVCVYGLAHGLVLPASFSGFYFETQEQLLSAYKGLVGRIYKCGRGCEASGRRWEGVYVSRRDRWCVSGCECGWVTRYMPGSCGRVAVRVYIVGGCVCIHACVYVLAIARPAMIVIHGCPGLPRVFELVPEDKLEVGDWHPRVALTLWVGVAHQARAFLASCWDHPDRLAIISTLTRPHATPCCIFTSHLLAPVPLRLCPRTAPMDLPRTTWQAPKTVIGTCTHTHLHAHIHAHAPSQDRVQAGFSSM